MSRAILWGPSPPGQNRYRVGAPADPIPPRQRVRRHDTPFLQVFGPQLPAMLIRRYGGLQSSEEKVAYNRAKMRRPTEYAENTEVGMTEIDAPGIKIRRKHGRRDDRDRCPRPPISKRARNKTYLHIFTPCHKHFSYSVFSACSVGRLFFARW